MGELAEMCPGGRCIISGESDIRLDEAKELAKDCKRWREIKRHKREFKGAGHLND
jgi:hypothetical protein